jgi:hypothetical protein
LAGETAKVVKIPIAKNKKGEKEEVFYLRLYDPSANSFVETEPGVITITGG